MAVWLGDSPSDGYFYTRSYRFYSSLFAYMFTIKKYNCISQIKHHLSIILYIDTHLHELGCRFKLFLVGSSILITWTSLFFEKWGLSYTNQEKFGQSYTFCTFCWKKGLVIYLAALKKWAIRHAHPYYVTYRKLIPTPAPPSPQGPNAYIKYSHWLQQLSYIFVPTKLCKHCIRKKDDAERSVWSDTPQPLYNTVRYNTVLYITRFKDGSQKCINYIEKWP